MLLSWTSLPQWSADTSCYIFDELSLCVWSHL